MHHHSLPLPLCVARLPLAAGFALHEAVEARLGASTGRDFITRARLRASTAAMSYIRKKYRITEEVRP